MHPSQQPSSARQNTCSRANDAWPSALTQSTFRHPQHAASRLSAATSLYIPLRFDAARTHTDAQALATALAQFRADDGEVQRLDRHVTDITAQLAKLDMADIMQAVGEKPRGRRGKAALPRSVSVASDLSSLSALLDASLALVDAVVDDGGSQ